MISLGAFILIAGITLVILLCWAWLPFALLAKLFRLGEHRKQGDLLPVRATAGEFRYRAEGFVPPPPVMRRDPHAFDPEVRHHDFLKADPRLAEQQFHNREARDAYEATFGLGRARSSSHGPRTGERRKKSAQTAARGLNSGVQKPAATLSLKEKEEPWEKSGHQAKQQQ